LQIDEALRNHCRWPVTALQLSAFNACGESAHLPFNLKSEIYNLKLASDSLMDLRFQI